MVNTIERGNDPANMTVKQLQAKLDAQQILLDRAEALKGCTVEFGEGINKAGNHWQEIQVYGPKLGKHISGYSGMHFTPAIWDTFKLIIPYIEEEVEAFRHMWDNK